MNKLSKKVLSILLISIFFLITLSACQGATSKESTNEKPNVITTTTMLADLASVIGGDDVNVEGLMGPGIDPHLYKASAGDVTKMQEANLIFYNGLHLEGKMGEIFENLESSGKLIVEIANGLPEDSLITLDDSDLHDPHVWFDVNLWKNAATVVKDGLIKLDESKKDAFEKRYEDYMAKLDELDLYVKNRSEELSEGQRVLITAHDAFGYFGKAYGFEVMGLQGISTASEAGTGDVRDLADFIVENKIKAVFVESSVPKKNIEALQEAVASRGFEVKIGGELFSDSLGSPDTEAGTYIGTVTSNIDTIVDALK
ncbi:MAG: zinc ABC transporter substrate-binding protein [Tissierellales bacterium]|jgi:manganese/zinc/iron transport system substrate-binding protein|nr:zinc ABC transporter substrate-binding protein [Tissierellales bacterium]